MVRSHTQDLAFLEVDSVAGMLMVGVLVVTRVESTAIAYLQNHFSDATAKLVGGCMSKGHKHGLNA